jgi:hypothetical protein
MRLVVTTMLVGVMRILVALPVLGMAVRVVVRTRVAMVDSLRMGMRMAVHEAAVGVRFVGP